MIIFLTYYTRIRIRLINKTNPQSAKRGLGKLGKPPVISVLSGRRMSFAGGHRPLKKRKSQLTTNEPATNRQTRQRKPSTKQRSTDVDDLQKAPSSHMPKKHSGGLVRSNANVKKPKKDANDSTTTELVPPHTRTSKEPFSYPYGLGYIFGAQYSAKKELDRAFAVSVAKSSLVNATVTSPTNNLTAPNRCTAVVPYSPPSTRAGSLACSSTFPNSETISTNLSFSNTTPSGTLTIAPDLVSSFSSSDSISSFTLSGDAWVSISPTARTIARLTNNGFIQYNDAFDHETKTSWQKTDESPSETFRKYYQETFYTQKERVHISLEDFNKNPSFHLKCVSYVDPAKAEVLHGIHKHVAILHTFTEGRHIMFGYLTSVSANTKLLSDDQPFDSHTHKKQYMYVLPTPLIIADHHLSEVSLRSLAKAKTYLERPDIHSHFIDVFCHDTLPKLTSHEANVYNGEGIPLSALDDVLTQHSHNPKIVNTAKKWLNEYNQDVERIMRTKDNCTRSMAQDIAYADKAKAAKTSKLLAEFELFTTLRNNKK